MTHVKEITVTRPDPVSAQLGEPIRVLVVAENTLLASAIVTSLERDDALSVCGIARTGADAAQAAISGRATIALIDFALSDMSGSAAVKFVRVLLPDIPIVFHNVRESVTDLLDAIDAGAVAYLTKSATADQMVDAIRRAKLGEVLIPASLLAMAVARQRTLLARSEHHDRVAAQFTARELGILRLLGHGLGTMAMSQELDVTVNTIEWHVGNVINKLGVHSKLQAVLAAARLGLIDIQSNERRDWSAGQSPLNE
jgi:NarL family two-component system response regulator LiaR